MIPCRDRLWRSVAFDRMYWIMRAAKGSPYNLFIIMWLSRAHGMRPYNCLTIYVRSSADGQWPSLQGIRVVGNCTCANGRAELAPTLSSKFFQLLSALSKHPFFTFFTFFPYVPFVPLSMSRCIRKMLLHRIFTYRLKNNLTIIPNSLLLICQIWYR